MFLNVIAVSIALARFSFANFAPFLPRMVPLALALARAAALETIWPPMTYMLIPSVLEKADDLILELRQAVEGAPEVAPLLERMEGLRRGFKRDTSYLRT